MSSLEGSVDWNSKISKIGMFGIANQQNERKNIELEWKGKL